MEKQNLQFVEINPDSPSTSETLGIAPERKDLLISMIEELIKSSGSSTQVLTAMSKQVETPAELSWVSFQMGIIMGKQKSRAGGLIAALLGKSSSIEDVFCNCPKCQARRGEIAKADNDDIHTMD